MIKRHHAIVIQRPSKIRSERPVPATKSSFVSHPSRDELYAEGKRLRDKCPRPSHAVWKAPADRPDPLALLKESSKGRISHLIPIRYGRMLQSPFTFYRGAALNMAADLAKTPVTGLRVQVCGDCHLLNFGLYATPERREIFAINDLDETLPAPWEWDVKRLAASFVLACRNNGFSEDTAHDVARACARSYRHYMAELSELSVLDVWYASMDAADLMSMLHDQQAREGMEKELAKVQRQGVLEHEFPKLADVVGRLPVIKDNPPLIYHWRKHKKGGGGFLAGVETAFIKYRETLREDRRLLLDHYEMRDIAIKVVGVGSVGTWCGIVLLMAGAKDPLFLQIKEAGASVLEPYAGRSLHANHGERVVLGCRMMQSASDLFLGWTVGPDGRHFYVRQLRDVKVKILVESFNRTAMTQYAKACGSTLARAHARNGQPARISGYLGKSDKFDRAIADFAIAYADQSERDHKILSKAARAGRLKVQIQS
jgi:uncharacterized protein (DUF2252 family)